MALHRAGQADQNGFVESFNGSFRDECLKTDHTLRWAKSHQPICIETSFWKNRA
ncbi:hypothetical protein CPT34_33100 [Rhizobium sophoriradicis]|uniref:Integrase catalytic domain-containing protein n=1 Tax=Rhizobium sophoriradicis TaxID=1535245 RepID=A0A2A5KIJ5_9HYPH|nr:hypothetical protein CPT34_33100 [Rhizobium sophoriradicis]